MKKYENFCNAYKNLTEAIALDPPYDIVTLLVLGDFMKLYLSKPGK